MQVTLLNPKLAVMAAFLLLLLLGTLNHWLFATVFDSSYLYWYSQTGPVIALGVAVISVGWGDLDKHTGLISANPLHYLGACLQAAGLPLVAVGAHFLPPYRLTPLGVNIIPLLLLSVLLVCAILGWLLLIVPLQYFVFLVTGAFSRAALTSSAQLVAKPDGVKLVIAERHGIKPINTAAGEWDASMRDKPFTLTNAFTATLLFVLGKVWMLI